MLPSALALLARIADALSATAMRVFNIIATPVDKSQG
jgi:hypothetical protein